MDRTMDRTMDKKDKKILRSGSFVFRVLYESNINTGSTTPVAVFNTFHMKRENYNRCLGHHIHIVMVQRIVVSLVENMLEMVSGGRAVQSGGAGSRAGSNHK